MVLCHGVGADGHDLIDLAPYWATALPQAAFVAPDAPEPYDGAPIGRQWFDALGPHAGAAGRRGAARRRRCSTPSSMPNWRGSALAGGRLCADGVQPGRDDGAASPGSRRPVPPRAILAFSGALLAPERSPKRRRAPPVLLVHGEADEVVPAVPLARGGGGAAGGGVRGRGALLPRLGHGIDEAGLSAGALFLQRAFARDSARPRVAACGRERLDAIRASVFTVAHNIWRLLQVRLQRLSHLRSPI